MGVWVQTKAGIINHIETLVRRLTEQESLSYMEKIIVSDAINAAMIDICMDYGVSRWRWLQEDVTVDTVGSQAYVDVDADIFNIISGTVRITAEDWTLSPFDLEVIYSADPGADVVDKPRMYALDSSSDPETIRLQLWPTPNGVYTIAFVAEKIVDEDAVSSFPSYLHAGLQDKATEVALRNLGMAVAALPFERSYEKRKNMAKASQGNDTPRYVNRFGGFVPDNRIQSRTP